MSGPSHAASFQFNSNGSFTYTPAYHYVGSDSFTYKVNDGVVDSDTTTVWINVWNNAPVAYDDVYSFIYLTELVVLAPGVLGNDVDYDGDAISAVLVASPAYGSVTLNSDGSFSYMPSPTNPGYDDFTYQATDGVALSQVARVWLHNTRPVPDIDTDSDNNGTIDGSLYEDGEEEKNPGKIVWRNQDDDNGNGTPDYQDPGPFRGPQGQPVMDDELVPARLSLDGPVHELQGFTLELTHSTNLKLWKTQDKEALALSYTLPAPFPAQIYVEGLDYGQGRVDWVLKNPQGLEVNRDWVKFTVAWLNLTAYRPQTEGPGYGSPFDRWPVSSNVEEVPGVGIRRNGDDDNGNQTPDREEAPVERENDLIEIRCEVEPATGAPGLQLWLKRTNQNITVWSEANKTTDWYGTAEQVHIPSPATGWVEWTTMDSNQTGANLELYAWDTTHSRPVPGSADIVHFYPFTSVVIAFGGWGAVPLDPAAGPFQMAQNLYDRGYDVHAYNERTLLNDPSPAYREVESAVQNRAVREVGVFGHSYGGGATYLLADQLNNTRAQIGDFTIAFTAYVDAIEWNTWTAPAEVRSPPGSNYHVNYYQTNSVPAGGPTAGPVAFNLDVNTTPWGAGLVHTTIDNDPTVQSRILDGSSAAGTEGPHAGLTQRIAR